MRLYGMLLGLLCAGCAATPLRPGDASGAEAWPGEGGMPRQETVYLVPVEDALMVARLLFEEQRYDVMEKEDGLELFTSAHEPGKNPTGSRTFERYYIQGERVAPRQAIVRIFRLRYNEAEDVVETPPGPACKLNENLGKANKAHPFNLTLDPLEGAPDMERFRFVRGTRDLDHERKLLERLEMVPSLELVGGNAAVPVRSVVMDGWAESGDTASQAGCGAPLAGVEPLLVKGHTVLLSDPLGTRELPSAALRMVCDAAEKGLPVTLALSLPSTEQPLLEKYLASAGRSQDAQELLGASSFWRREYQDGRSSRAILWLIEQARRLRASGKDVALVAFDSEKAKGNEREAEMAKHLLEYRKEHAGSWMLVLAGAVHVRTAKVGWDEGFEPLGVRLAKELKSVRALDVGFSRGTQFSCRYSVWEDVECNLFAISPTDEARHSPSLPAGVRIFSEPLEEGFHGRLYLGTLSASPPALQPGAEAASAGVAPRAP